MATVVEFESPQLVNDIQDLFIEPQNKMKSTTEETSRVGCENNHHGICAVCLNKIVLQETALVKGCEHAYCVTCILRWATYKEEPTCPQCKHPFEFLYIHRSLDGSLQDYMFEESVCLLLRASWFKPLIVEEKTEIDDDMDDLYMYDDADDDFTEDYFISSSSRLRIGNRRWGDNGYVSAGRQEARPVYRPNPQESGAGSSREPNKETAGSKELVGRRAKRALKREAADKAAAEKHQQRLVRMGRK
ncbi:hypothetical protein KY290_008275 [Solanum tuberosum]|uniref:RING-type domain-containing protein n=3 Tax=Solanum tuberosum TaxID=4113 RepID=A0ABQ7W9W2_SOLTU|nr:PREDICTED: uncharacterized protein LOC102590911 [Solanum tuberosum]KAH0712688.1 hypothetical protein KY289_008647 [Solanum tuberosum]KAH0747522.1 hypothetical protein KY285_009179 [Solanum tuberosum]KAH0776864.1 hypothetical protein KY290_008275 [Solanum tuberosum]